MNSGGVTIITITAVSGETQNYSTCADAVQFIYQSGLKDTIPENNGGCSGDFNSNGVVDGFDLAVFSQAYANVDFSADLNSNGIVDADDLAILATELGRTDCQ